MKTKAPSSTWIHSILTLQFVNIAIVFLGPFAERELWDFQVLSARGMFGALLLAVGCVVGLWSLISMGRFITVYPKPKNGSRLLKAGIYRIVRNPMYLAVLTSGLGWSLVYAVNWTLSFLALLLFVFIVKIQFEEQFLENTFGAEYIRYKNRTKSLIPYLY